MENHIKTKRFPFRVRAVEAALTEAQFRNIFADDQLTEDYFEIIADFINLDCELVNQSRNAGLNHVIQIFTNCRQTNCRKYKIIISKESDSQNMHQVSCWTNKTVSRRHRRRELPLAEVQAEELMENEVSSSANDPSALETDAQRIATREGLLNVIHRTEMGFGQVLNDEENQLDIVIRRLKKQYLENQLGDFQDMELFQIFKRMPKGGLLHSHLKAISTEVLQEDNIRINLWQLGSIRDGPKFKYSLDKPKSQRLNDQEIEWRPVQELEMEEGYLDSFRKMMLVDQNSSNAWTSFQSIFDVIGDFLENFEFFQKFFKRILVAVLEDGIQFLEIRATFSEVIFFEIFSFYY